MYDLDVTRLTVAVVFGMLALFFFGVVIGLVLL